MKAERRNKGADDPMERVLAHYRIAAPIIEQTFECAQLFYQTYPQGLDKPGAFHGNPIPMTTPDLLVLVQEKGAVEFQTTGIVVAERTDWAQVALWPGYFAPFESVKRAARLVGALMAEMARFTVIPVLDGKNGMALWMDLDGLRKKDAVRMWVRRLCHDAVARNPELLTVDGDAVNADRVYVRSMVGLPTSVPYGLRAPSLGVTIPVTWSELDSFAGADAVGIDDFPRRSTNYPLHRIGGSHGFASER
jgi:DNA primase